MSLKVGDRVYHNRDGLGLVVCLHSSLYDYIGVMFDTKEDGHDLCGMTSIVPRNSSNCWFYEARVLTKVSEKDLSYEEML